MSCPAGDHLCEDGFGSGKVTAAHSPGRCASRSVMGKNIEVNAYYYSGNLEPCREGNGSNAGSQQRPITNYDQFVIVQDNPSLLSMPKLDPGLRASNHPDGSSSLGLDIILKGHHRQIITGTSFLSQTKHL